MTIIVQRGFVEACADDGLLEVFGFKQGWHASMVMVELISAKHITQVAQQLYSNCYIARTLVFGNDIGKSRFKS